MSKQLQPKDIQILLVDDDKDVLAALSNLFTVFGFSVASASNIQDAWTYIQAKPVHIVISDIRMPGGSGIDLLKLIRARDPENPKVLFISGFTDFSEQDIYDLGGDGFFAKPFSSKALREAIQSCLVRREDRWASIPPRPPVRQVVRTVSGLNRGLSIGRSGFFLPLSGDPLHIGDVVEFDFTLRDATPTARMHGYGVVRWIRFDNSEALPAGAGVEIVYLDNGCRTSIVKWLDSNKRAAFIPRI